MCLMCVWYTDSCEEPECVEKAKAMPVELEYYYRGRTKPNGDKGLELFLWKGGTEVVCEHILANHGPECEALQEVGNTCNCFKVEEGWEYEL